MISSRLPPTFIDPHLRPSFDHLPVADDELKKLIPVQRAIEFGAILKPAGVVNHCSGADLSRGSGSYNNVSVLQARRGCNGRTRFRTGC